MPSAMYGVSFSQVVGWWDPITVFPTLQVVAIALGYLPELDGKTLPLKTPYTSVTAHGEMKLAPTGSFGPAGLLFYFWKV